MLAVPIANGNLITLTPVNGLYDPNLPTRLNGIISAEDFRGSIERCNDVYRKNKAYYLLSVVILIGGVLAGLAVFIAGQVTLNFAILFAGLGIFVGSAVIGTCLCGFVGRKMVDGLNQAVQAEHVRYAAPVPGRPPISWSINQPVVMGPNMRWRRGSYEINIEVGKSFQGSPIAMGQQFPYGQGQPIVYSAAYPPQPQYQPYQQSPAQAQVQSQTQAHPPPFQSYAQPSPQLPPPSYEASEPTSTYSADYAAPVKSS